MNNQKQFFCALGQTVCHKLTRGAMLCVLLLLIGSSTVFGAVKIREVEYKGKGVVEIEFPAKVQYKKPAVQVLDQDGNAYKAAILTKTAQELRFKIRKYASGKTYSFTVKGIRSSGDKKYGSLNAKMYIPENAFVKGIEYDKSRKTLELEFASDVCWQSPKASIRSGKTQYADGILEKSSSEIKLKVKKLPSGKEYTFKLTGLKKEGGKKAITLKESFVW